MVARNTWYVINISGDKNEDNSNVHRLEALGEIVFYRSPVLTLIHYLDNNINTYYVSFKK